MNKEFKEIILSIKRLFTILNKNERRALYISTGIMIVTGVLTNLPAVILGRLVDRLTKINEIHLQLAVPFITLIVGVVLVREILTVIRKYLVENVATVTDKEQTVSVIDRLLKTDISNFLYQQQIGTLHGRIFRSVQGLVRLIKLMFLDFAPLFFSAIAAIAIALTQKPLIASVMILVIPAGLYIIFKQISSQKGIRVELLRGKENIDGKVVEMLGGIETIRSFNTVDHEVNKVETVAEKLRQKEIRHHIQMAFFDAAKYLNEGMFFIFVIVLSIFFASKGLISSGDILVYSILFTSVISPLREIHRVLDQAHESSIQVNDLYELLHQPLDESYMIDETTKAPQKSGLVIKLDNVSFVYPKKEGGTLDNINLTINEGEKIGIAGASGGGKTTLIHLLLKLKHGYSGKIELLGKDLVKISRSEIAEKIAYVPQKPFIFSGTIRENIVYGKKLVASEKEIIQAAKNACIYDEIKYKLGGFDGRVSENGNNLSGGQKQRLAIARVMLQSPELIIFDEATSALDNTNEAKIQQNIGIIFRGKTIISIAHRLTTLKNSDRIFVLDKGRVVQEGDFEDLSKTVGPFQRFLQQRQTE